MRKEFPAKVKIAAFERAKGHCQSCGFKIIGRAEYDHVLPDWLGGAKRSKNPMPGSRASKYKRTMDGRTVLR